VPGIAAPHNLTPDPLFLAPDPFPMQFALLGEHPDGLAIARALVGSGRHELLAYSGPPVGAEYLKRWSISARAVGDVEEVLADPAIRAVIIAANPSDRPAQLRRALQSERHVLCVHPADLSPDIAYEAAMIQADTRVVLLPLLPEAFHPAVRRLAELLRDMPPEKRLIDMERASTESVLLETGTAGYRPAVPGWDTLRHLGGEIVEIVGISAMEEMAVESPVLLAGRFQNGGLFQMMLLPLQADTRWRITVRTALGQIDLVFPEGWPGPARLAWRDESGEAREETWESCDPWAPLVELFETAAATGDRSPLMLSWQDEIRCLELDDAARRSVERRRASTLEYQEVTEEVGFKGTMTLVGCALLWGSLVILMLSVWLPWLAWAILPVFGLFLALQVLRWLVPPRP
jgi:predicted dehydrogenase